MGGHAINSNCQSELPDKVPATAILIVWGVAFLSLTWSDAAGRRERTAEGEQQERNALHLIGVRREHRSSVSSMLLGSSNKR